ncbi:hypothetical protein GCM10009836_06630 [Pseudonocardia ailaonensis]|uniref:HTH marR-type domain-containing protein n=1 Tax=Pseudonocardia ailaonensis TaxID=367279 RepID=A0ABN2MPE6_9PSEU
MTAGTETGPVRTVDDADPAVRVWKRMRALVIDQHDRRRAAADAVGLSPVRVRALLEVVREPAMLSDLAERLSVDRPYATVVVDDLQRRGLVRRVPHAADRRCKIVSATTEGIEAAARASAIMNDPPAELRSLAAADLAELDRVLGSF